MELLTCVLFLVQVGGSEFLQLHALSSPFAIKMMSSCALAVHVELALRLKH